MVVCKNCGSIAHHDRRGKVHCLVCNVSYLPDNYDEFKQKKKEKFENIWDAPLPNNV